MIAGSGLGRYKYDMAGNLAQYNLIVSDNLTSGAHRLLAAENRITLIKQEQYLRVFDSNGNLIFDDTGKTGSSQYPHLYIHSRGHTVNTYNPGTSSKRIQIFDSVGNMLYDAVNEQIKQTTGSAFANFIHENNFFIYDTYSYYLARFIWNGSNYVQMANWNIGSLAGIYQYLVGTLIGSRVRPF
jgi:hypothetical protein